MSTFPIIWAGGFIVGMAMIYNGLKQRSRVRVLLKDFGKDEAKKKQEESVKDDARYVIITCGKCFRKIRIRKGRGVTKIKCPNCSGEYSVKT